MKPMKCKHKRRTERGFWSAATLIMLVTLSLMGMGAFVLIKSEGKNVTNEARALQAEYSANGGAYFGIKQLELGPVSAGTHLTIGSGTVSLDTSSVSGSEEVLLTVIGTVDDIQRGFLIHLIPIKLMDKAIFTTGDVNNVSGKDSLGTIDPDMVVTDAGSVPTIDEATLAAMSTAQGHDQSDATFSPGDGYPNGSFYQPDGVTPNVTHVLHDFKALGGKTLYGIFVVEGNVILNGSSRIQGVIYLPNQTSTVITGGADPTESTVTGGLISHGDIYGIGNHISVIHCPEYMRAFCQFQSGPDRLRAVISWEYI